MSANAQPAQPAQPGHSPELACCAEDAGGTAGGSDGMEMEASASGGMMAGYEQEDDGIAGAMYGAAA